MSEWVKNLASAQVAFLGDDPGTTSKNFAGNPE